MNNDILINKEHVIIMNIDIKEKRFVINLKTNSGNSIALVESEKSILEVTSIQ